MMLISAQLSSACWINYGMVSKSQPGEFLCKNLPEKPFVQSDGHGRQNHRTCKKIGLIKFGQSIKTAVAVKKSGKKRA